MTGKRRKMDQKNKDLADDTETNEAVAEILDDDSEPSLQIADPEGKKASVNKLLQKFFVVR